MYEEEIRLAFELYRKEKKIEAKDFNITQLRYFLKMVGVQLDDDAL